MKDKNYEANKAIRDYFRKTEKPESGKKSFKDAKKRAFACGGSISYKDEKGRMVQEFANGRIVELLDIEGETRYVQGEELRGPTR